MRNAMEAILRWLFSSLTKKNINLRFCINGFVFIRFFAKIDQNLKLKTTKKIEASSNAFRFFVTVLSCLPFSPMAMSTFKSNKYSLMAFETVEDCRLAYLHSYSNSSKGHTQTQMTLGKRQKEEICFWCICSQKSVALITKK